MSFPWLVDLPTLSPDSFPWEEYEADNSWMINGYKAKLPNDWTPIGKIDGNNLIIRPRPGIAVLFELSNGNKCWQHVYSGPFEAVVTKINRISNEQIEQFPQRQEEQPWKQQEA